MGFLQSRDLGMAQLISEFVDASPAPDRRRDEMEEFEYRPVPPLAPITMFLGVCGIAGLAGIPALAISFVGVITGLLCLWQIARSEGALGGKLVAQLGLALSFLFLASGTALHAYTYITELPEGHERVSFNWLSKQPQKMTREGIELTPEVAALDGKPIFIKGYMYPTRQQTGMTEFVLVKDTGQCCFGGNPKLTDMIVVKFHDGMTVNHKEQTLVSVAGTFHAGAVTQSGELTAVYTLDGTHFQ